MRHADDDESIISAFVTAVEEMSAELSRTTMSANYKPYVVVRSKGHGILGGPEVNCYVTGTSTTCTIPTASNSNDGVSAFQLQSGSGYFRSCHTPWPMVPAVTAAKRHYTELLF